MFAEVFERFIQDSPVSVMFRGTLANVFRPERLDKIFAESAQKQYEHELLFSTCAELMSLVVGGMRKSVNAAHRAHKHEVAVAVKSVYSKLAGIEPVVSRQMVRETAADLLAVIGHLRGEVAGPLSGYEVRIVDGNHLAGTEHRIEELQRLGAAALPGHSVAILNPQTQLIEDAVLCEDGHANERLLIPDLLREVCKGQCWIADSNFCTLAFLFGFPRGTYFIVRHHGSLHGELVGRRQKVGRCENGMVYQQKLRVTKGGSTKDLRRITVVRDKPTQKGEKEVHILSNLPVKVGALKIAQAYRKRWKIETAFQDLATTLRSEINTLGYPDAALFGFCIALVLFNILSTVKAALRGAKGVNRERNLSTYYLADEIAGVWRGMEIAVPTECWRETFSSLPPGGLANKLSWWAKKDDLSYFYSNPWTPKKPPRKKISGNRGKHVSTYRILQQRKQKAQE